MPSARITAYASKKSLATCFGATGNMISAREVLTFRAHRAVLARWC
jgi:hypothetical protein